MGKTYSLPMEGKKVACRKQIGSIYVFGILWYFEAYLSAAHPFSMRRRLKRLTMLRRTTNNDDGQRQQCDSAIHGLKFEMCNWVKSQIVELIRLIESKNDGKKLKSKLRTFVGTEEDYSH